MFFVLLTIVYIILSKLSWKYSDQSLMLSYHPCPSHPLNLLYTIIFHVIIRVMPYPQLYHAMPSLFYDIIMRTPSYSMSSYVSCHILNYSMPCHHYFMTSSLGHHHIPCHHMCLATSSTMPCHAITTLFFHWVYPYHHIHWLFLSHSWTPLTLMTTIYSTYLLLHALCIVFYSFLTHLVETI